MTTLLAIWGAVLSTVLGLVKLHEEWEKRRLRIEVEGAFISSVEIGHRIDIRNLGSRPSILKYWEVVSIGGCWPARRENAIEAADFDDADIQIGADDSRSLRFAEARHFAERGNTYVRLHIAGRRRSVLRRISR